MNVTNKPGNQRPSRRLQASIDLARKHGVREESILKSTADLGDFLAGKHPLNKVTGKK